MIEALWLIKNGFSEKTAFSLDRVTRAAFSIVLGNLDRPPEEAFDFAAWAFPEPKA